MASQHLTIATTNPDDCHNNVTTFVADADYLPNILRSMVIHLQNSGFVWVEKLTADCGDVQWSSEQ